MSKKFQIRQSQVGVSDEKLRLIVRQEMELQNRKMFWLRLPSLIVTALSWIERIVMFEHHH